jgi:hypothetical protein
MKNFITNHLLEQTWLNESEINIILTVIADGLKIKNPELESSIYQLLEIELQQQEEIIQSKSKIYLSI